MDGSKVEYNRIVYTGRISGVPQQPGSLKKANNGASNAGFDAILKEAIQKEQAIKISKHAQIRMRQRNIWLSQNDMERIGWAIEKAREKGVRDSLVLMGNLAFIVNVPTGTIVTAVDGENIKENIFTNIDGAVVL